MKKLTEKDLKIIDLICKEFTTVEIAEILGIKLRTLEGLRANIMEKTKAKSSIGLYKYALKNKLVKLR